MGQQLQPRQSGKSWQSRKSWRSAGGEKLWLSMLVDAMEKLSRPELRGVPCDRLALAAVRAQLALPASTYLPHSHFSLRN
jgi:hypothetical protein